MTRTTELNGSSSARPAAAAASPSPAPSHDHTMDRHPRASISPTASPARRLASPAPLVAAHRPTSPGKAALDGPPSPARSFVSDAGPFERDVEFSSDHLLSATEAVDVAIPPVLSEAALALANEDLPTVLARAASNTSLAAAGPSPSAASDSFGPLYLPPAAHQPGWQSPSLTYALEQAEHAGSPSSSSALDSPPSGGWDRVGSPATSPEPPLLEAKLAAACVSEPPNTASPLSSAPNSPRSLSPAPMLTVMPFPGSAANNATMTVSPGGSPQQMSKGSMSSDGLRDRRRLSFLSYADLINIERGNPPAQDSTWETSALAAALQDDSTMSPMSELGENRDAGDKDEDTLTMKARSRRTPPALNLESA